MVTVAVPEAPARSPQLDSLISPLANGIGLITPGGAGGQTKFLSTAEKMRLGAAPTSLSTPARASALRTMPMPALQQLPPPPSPPPSPELCSPTPRNPFAKVPPDSTSFQRPRVPSKYTLTVRLHPHRWFSSRSRREHWLRPKWRRYTPSLAHPRQKDLTCIRRQNCLPSAKF
jgi:hypothetical protein